MFLTFSVSVFSGTTRFTECIRTHGNGVRRNIGNGGLEHWKRRAGTLEMEGWNTGNEGLEYWKRRAGWNPGNGGMELCKHMAGTLETYGWDTENGGRNTRNGGLEL